MRSIIDKIKDSVESIIGKCRFYYNDDNGLNVDFDNAEYPLAYARLIETGTLVDTLGNYHERVTISIFFADVADPDLQPMPNEDILTVLKHKALAWLASLRLNEELDLIEVRNTDRVYITSNDYDVRLTAYVVNVTLEEVEGIGICNTKAGCGCK